MRRSQLYKRLRDAVEVRGDDSGAVEGMGTRAARALIGPEAKGMTTTLIRNAKRTLAAELRRKEMQATADWILSRVLATYPNAEVDIRRGRIVSVYLDGKPAEVEE